MRIEDIFEEMRPVATVWKKRGDKLERGRISKFAVNLKQLTNIKVEREEKEESDGSGRKDPPGISS